MLSVTDVCVSCYFGLWVVNGVGICVDVCGVVCFLSLGVACCVVMWCNGWVGCCVMGRCVFFPCRWCVLVSVVRCILICSVMMLLSFCWLWFVMFGGVVIGVSLVCV